MTWDDDALLGGPDVVVPVSSAGDPPLFLDYCETGVSPIPAAVRRVHEHAHELNHYPRGLCDHAVRAIAAAHGVSESQVLLTNGVDEATDLVLLEARALTCVTPGFVGYWERANALDVAATYLPLTAEWELPEQWWHAAHPGSAFVVAQPNNPTGSSFGSATWLDEALAMFSLVVVDETYRLVADAPMRSCVHREEENLLTFISLSKAYGLAGVRVGALVGSPPMIERLARRKRFYSIDNLALHAVIGALEDPDAVASATAAVKRLRPAYARAIANAVGLFAEARMTDCTFVLGRVHERIGAHRLVAELAAGGVMVSDCAISGMPGWLRVGVTDAATITKLTRALQRCELALGADQPRRSYGPTTAPARRRSVRGAC
jgi:histidinol-phosphate aminotransferase